MDDNGHGTHVAGIIAAVANNRQGIAGISTGKVVAVKALSAQGLGTNFDIAAAINYCANRRDIKVINMSLGGSALSTLIQTAVDYAVNTKGKLIVAAAGNDNTDAPQYPAFFSNTDPNGSAACAPNCPTFPRFADKVISVAASGLYYEDPPGSGTWWLDNDCRANYSNYGAWVSIVAPGTDIYSTLPWDKPFYLNSYEGFNTRYDSLSSTSMATPFVAAAAARRWGYKPRETNAQIGADLKAITTSSINGDGTCWPTSIGTKPEINVAALLDRGALAASAYDSITGLPLNGAMIGMYQGTTLKGKAVITPSTWNDPYEPDPTRIYTQLTAFTDVVNLPVGTGYVPKVIKTGYTASPQPAFQHAKADTIAPGLWTPALRAAVPPKSGNFNVTTSWWVWLDDPTLSNPASPWDLDTNVWLPNTPNPLDTGQPSPFIIAPKGNAFGFGEDDPEDDLEDDLEDNPYGSITAFPFGRFSYEGGFMDEWHLEDVTIANRVAHDTVAANAGLPYYPGDYVVMMTDYGQTIDHDRDGCGDNYGTAFDPNYDPAADPECPPNNPSGTPGIPLLGTYYTPWIYVWKDGVINAFAGFNPNNLLLPVDPGDTCNAHWWKGLTMTSGLTGRGPTFTANNECGNAE